MLTQADKLLLALLAHRETPTASVEAIEAAEYLRASRRRIARDHWGGTLPYHTGPHSKRHDCTRECARYHREWK